jgi:hypothetical protein
MKTPPNSPIQPSSECPTGMCEESLVAHAASAAPIFVPKLKRSFLGGRSRTSGTPIIHRSAAHPVTPPQLTLVASLAGSMGNAIKVPPLNYS